MTMRHALAAVLTTMVLLAASPGCATLGLSANRLQSCQSNDDCKKKDEKKPACSNLRCVECAYDEDCPSGGLCTDNQCKTLFTSAGEGAPDEAPKNLDACLSRCNDKQACVDKCHEQFQPADAPK